MHECPDCGQACDCDSDDLWRDAPIDCECACEDFMDEYDEWNDPDDTGPGGHGLECTCEMCIQDHPERIALYMDDE